MNFLHLRETFRGGGGGALAVLLFFAVFLVVQYYAPNFLVPIAARAALPLLSARAAFREVWANSVERAARRELAALRIEHAYLTALVQANVPTTSGAETGRGITASILAQPRWSAYDTLLLGAGTIQGVAVGMRVRADGFVVGEIAETYHDSSLAILYSTAGKKVTAQIAGTIPVELIGAGGGAFTVSIAESAPVRAGDGAFVPGLSPRLFAIVDAVTAGSESTLTVRLRLPVNLFELRTVEIVPSF